MPSKAPKLKVEKGIGAYNVIDENGKVIDAGYSTAEFAENGSLDSAVANQLLNPKPIVAAEPIAAIKTVSEDEAAQLAIEEALNNVPAREVSSAPAMSVPYNQESIDEEKASFTREIQELRGALEAANTLIKEMNAAKTQHNSSKVMPMLPQFKNACPYAVLGLGQLEATKITVVKKAFREIIKCGYGAGHEAFELITKAKDLLLSDIEAAKKTK